MSNTELKNRLQDSLETLKSMIHRVTADAHRAGIAPLELRNPSGEYTLVPLIVAQANVLAALAYLEGKP
jgi:hypothetical protein